MATVNLGSIKFKWKGAYSGSTAYTIDDVVSYNGSSYICILASTGNLPTNTTYFEQMSQAGTNGTNGTDLTTTLTTQGDLVYRDGSGLQRLGAGTSGQVLQTGGSGANPSWTTMSSDMVKLGEVNVSSAVSEIAFENVCNSTYSMYKLYGSHIKTSSSSYFGVQVGYGSTPTYITSNDYISMTGAHYTDFSTNDFTWCDVNNGSNRMHMYFDDDGSARTQNMSLEVMFTGFDPSLNSDPTMIMQKNGSSSSWYQHSVGTGWCNNSTARSNQITSVKLQRHSGNINAGKFVFYGIK